MKDEGLENNGACVVGRIMPGARYSHEAYGERFYRADILACRASGVTDMVPLMVSEKIADLERDCPDSIIEVTGQFRSYNRKEEGKSRLELFVFVQGIRYLDDGYVDCGNNNLVCLNPGGCTGRAYTCWYRIVCRQGRMWAYHDVAYDV